VVVANVLAIHRDRNHSKAWPKSVLGPMDKVLDSPHRQSSEGFREFSFYLRRTVSFLFASTLLIAGLAFSVIGIVQPQGSKPFVFFNALILIAAGGVWLLDERHH
jgi:hypothetical protein